MGGQPYHCTCSAKNSKDIGKESIKKWLQRIFLKIEKTEIWITCERPMEADKLHNPLQKHYFSDMMKTKNKEEFIAREGFVYDKRRY